MTYKNKNPKVHRSKERERARERERERKRERGREREGVRERELKRERQFILQYLSVNVHFIHSRRSISIAWLYK